MPFKKGSKAAKGAGRKAANTRRKNAKKWIQSTRKKIKKGALHRALGVPLNQHLNPVLLNRICKAKIGTSVSGHKVTRKLKDQVIWAINTRPK